MAEMAAPVTELIDGMSLDFPEHVPGTRPIHTVGIGVAGEFRASRAAAEYCVAEHFDGRCFDVVVRFSNGNGQADPDGRLQVRGMAVKFYVDGKPPKETDLVCMSVPMFMAQTSAKVLDFEKAYEPRRVRRPSLVNRLKSLVTMCPLPPQEAGVLMSGNDGLVAWSKEYKPSQGFIVANSMQRLPASYARTVFYAVHAFEVEDPRGNHRMVRFSLEPSDGVRSAGPPEVIRPPIEAALRQDPQNTYGTTLPSDYLRQELRDRLEYAPSHFDLRMQIADPWDDTADPTKVWPMSRRRVLMGTLKLRHVVEDQISGCEELSFNPGHLLPGMGISDDPVLRDRAAIYEESYQRRMAARRNPQAAPASLPNTTGCPMGPA